MSSNKLFGQFSFPVPGDRKPRLPKTAQLLYRKHSRPHVFCFTLVCTIVLFCQSEKLLFGQGMTQKVVRFVGEVAVDAEYANGVNVVKRWVEPAKLSIFNADQRQTEAVEAAVQEINKTLESTFMEIQMLGPNDDEATLQVHFAPLKEFPEKAETLGLTFVEDNWGFFYSRWNRNFEIKAAKVLLASDRLRGNRLKHFALEEVIQALGFAGDSPRFSDSVFYEDQQRREYGTAREFSDLDAKLIRFLYRRAEPGTHAVELGLLMAEHWNRDN